MSDIENVSVEIRELLELVLAEPDQPEKNAILSSEEQHAPPTDNGIQSMNVQPEISSIDPQPKDSVVVVNKQIDTVPEPDLRVIESNALKLIAQYGSDSDSESVESDNETTSSDEVVAIDDVDVLLQRTIADGNYRVVSSNSDER